MALQVSRSMASGAVPKVGPDFGRAIASLQVTDPFGLTAFESEIPHPSKILAEHSEGDEELGQLYERMQTADAMLAGLVEKRTKAVTGLPFDIVPRDESRKAKKIADFCAEIIWSIRALEVNLAHQLGGIFRGIAFDELIWDVRASDGAWVVTDIVDRPMSRFGFKYDATTGGYVLCRRDRAKNSLIPVKPGKFLVMSHGTKDSPWGAALFDRLYWAHFMWLHCVKYAGVAMEKWAQPTAIGKYRRGDGENAASENDARAGELLSAIAAIQTEYALVVPEDAQIALLEAQRGGSVNYEGFIQLIDRWKANVILGEVDTSGLAKGPGSFAKSRVSDDVRFETIVADATELGNGLTDNLLTPLVRVNFGADAPVPYWQFDVEEASDRQLRQAGVAAVLDRGQAVTKSYFYRVHQVPEPKDGQDVVGGVSAAPPSDGSAASFSVPVSIRWDDQELAA